MDGDSFDTIVIGGGIVGCATAWELGRRGRRVALVERGRLGEGTTARSFAWINATSKVGDEAYHRLNARGCVRHRELAAAFGEARLGLLRSGMLQVVRSGDRDRRAAVEEQAGHLAAYGHPHRLIDRRALVALEPAVRFDADAMALEAPVDDWIDAPRFARALAEAAAGGGARVLEGTDAGELRLADDGAVTGVATTAGVLACRDVVLAAGADTPAVLARLTGHESFASRFPLRRVAGLLVDTPPLGDSAGLRRILYADLPGAEIHLRPTPDGGLRLGADDTDGMIAEDSSRDDLQRAAAVLLDRARRLLPALDSSLTAADCALMVGVRPYPADGRTIAGTLPGARGLHVVATHSGITLAPALGELIARLVVEGQPPHALRPFALERLPGFA